MTTILDSVRPLVRALSPYRVRELGSGITCMDKNENPYELPDTLKKAVFDAMSLQSWGRYPPIVAMDLHNRIARYAGWVKEGVVAGNGSDELILTILLTFLEPGRRIVLPNPTFPMFNYMATLIGAEVVDVPLNNDYTIPYDEVERVFLDRGDVLAVCSPNNPTGGMYDRDRIINILKKTTRPVIVDEAYFEFSRETVLDLIKTYPNLIVMRTFSKAFSLAGQRIGYALMDPAVAEEVLKAKMPFNIDLFSIAAAMTLLDHAEEMATTVDTITAERDRIFNAMMAMPDVTVYPSKANFLLFKTPYSPARLLDGIIRRGLLIRDLSANPTLAGTLRVTVSLPEDNDRFLDALAQSLRECAS